MIVGILALDLVLLVFFNSRYITKQNNHYIAVDDFSSIMSMKSFQSLSGCEKEMVFKTFELSQQVQKNIHGDENKRIYDLHKLKELTNVDVLN